MSQPNDFARDGAPIIGTLNDIRRRVKIFSLAFGIGLVVASAVGLLLTTVFLDWLLNLPAWPRLVVILAAVGTVGYAVMRFVVRPLIHKLSIGDLAGLLEHAFPQFDDRLRSTVDFVSQDIPGSVPMKDRVVREAAQLAKTNDLRSAVVARPVYLSAAGALGALVICTGIFALLPSAYRDAAFDRLLTPFSGAAWPKSTQIEMLGAVPQRMAAGQQTNISWKLAKGSSRTAIFMYRYDNGSWDKTVVQADANGVFTAPIDAQLEQGHTGAKLDIHIETGDDTYDASPVKVVPRLEIASVEAVITPPAYVGDQTPTVVSLGERAAVMAQGSSVVLRVDFNKDLNTAKPVRIEQVKADSDGSAAPSSQPALQPNFQWTIDPSHPNLAVAKFNADRNFTPDQPYHFTIHATDTDGFTNTAPQNYQILVREDQLPTGVQIQKPRQNEERPANAVFDVTAAADDDYGLVHADLMVNLLNADATRKQSVWTLPLAINTPIAMADHQHYDFAYTWDLSKLENVTLRPGDVLEYYIKVKDNFQLEGKDHPWVSSPKLRISIISADDWNLEAGRQIELIRKQIEALQKGQTLTKQDTVQLADTVKKTGMDQPSLDQNQRIASDQSDHAAQTHEAAQKLTDLQNKMAENQSPKTDQDNVDKVSKLLDQTAEGPMKDADNKLGKAGDPKPDPKATAAEKKADSDRRAEQMESAAASQDQAAQDLQKAENQLGKPGLDKAIDQIKNALEEQKKLDKDYANKSGDMTGKKPEELTKDQRDQNAQMSKQQQDIQKKTQAALDSMAKSAKDSQASDPSQAEAMKQAGKTADQQQVTSKQQSSSQSMQQNQQADAQDSQQQVELGLQQVLKQLEDAKKAELKDLQEKLAKMQKLIQDLIARQAGHNMDNLRMQDNGAMDQYLKLETSQRQEIEDNAGRDMKNLPEVPTIRGLAESQEQTLGNARSLTSDAANVPDATIGAKLTAAASAMERAISTLREDKPQAERLTNAYDPPQHEALDRLLEAQKTIDQDKKDVDNKVNSDAQEAIRQAYVELLAKQKVLDQDVTTLDKSRGADGMLNRADAMKLSPQMDDGMPARQGKNSATASTLSDKLKDLGSVEFVSATQDVVESMNDVKEMLSNSKTGVATQAQQGEIEEDLQNIIDSLKQTPPDKPKFDKPKGGGGGGGGGGGKKPPPKMPLEPEIRLAMLRQKSINKAVTTIDQAVKAGQEKDIASLLKLGVRQGKLRNELNTLLDNASQHKVHFNKEPDDDGTADQNSTPQQVQDHHNDQDLLNGKPDNSGSRDGIEKTIANLGDDMARARKLLAIKDDPGANTQKTQTRIIDEMTELLALAQQQQQQQQQQSSGQPKPGDPQQGPPKPGDPQQGPQTSGPPKPGPHQEKGTSPAQQSVASQGGTPNVDPGQLAADGQAGWTKISPVKIGDQRNAATDRAVGGYGQYDSKYFQELMQKASQPNQ